VTAGPARINGELLSVRRAGAYHHLTIRTPGIDPGTRAGHFVALAAGERLRRRAFWVFAVETGGLYGGTVEIAVEVRGAGTSWLTGLRPGDPVDVLGPLGRPFALPREPVSCLLVGDGHGSAPLFGLARGLIGRGCQVHMRIGADDQSRLLGALAAKRVASTVGIATGDGSVGVRGPVTRLVNDAFLEHRIDVAYACGSNPVLRAVAEAATVYGAHSQCAVEPPMPCGTGLCWSCAVDLTDGSGTVRGCVEGPVLAGNHVNWEQL
jgi:dihydroorotate dehydrogenase electron transfer subunit